MYILIFLLSVVLSFFLALIIKKIASHYKIEDYPDDLRKRHKKPVPLLGGVGLFLSFFIIIFFLYFLNLLSYEMMRLLLWLFIASFVIIVGGVLDDIFSLNPKIQIIFPLIAISLVLFGGVRVGIITNPYGGILNLGIFTSLIISFFWLFTITYTTKILDGLDGLVSGIVILGAGSIFLFTTITNFKEQGLSFLSLVLAGVFIGFLFLNKYPAKFFLGESGSLFSGFILGSLAILTGAKIAITLMVLALPLIDFLSVILKRFFLKNKSIFKGDRMHLHFLLVDRGWKPQNVVFLFWGVSGVLGIVSIFLPSILKVLILSLVILIFFVIDIFFFKDV